MKEEKMKGLHRQGRKLSFAACRLCPGPVRHQRAQAGPLSGHGGADSRVSMMEPAQTVSPTAGPKLANKARVCGPRLLPPTIWHC